MPQYFLDPLGEYIETMTDVATPPNHTAVAQRPSPYHSWDGSAWVELPNKLELELQGARAGAVIDFAALMRALVVSGRLSAAQALDWSKGTIPAGVQSAIDAIPDIETRAQVNAEARRDSRFRRDSDFIAALKDGLGATDEQVDGLFGISV